MQRWSDSAAVSSVASVTSSQSQTGKEAPSPNSSGEGGQGADLRRDRPGDKPNEAGLDKAWGGSKTFGVWMRNPQTQDPDPDLFSAKV